jgi:hypothetical protein
MNFYTKNLYFSKHKLFSTKIFTAGTEIKF